jgi:hypothetical protein
MMRAAFCETGTAEKKGYGIFTLHLRKKGEKKDDAK